MRRLNATFARQRNVSQRKRKVLFYLFLTTVSCLLWTGCSTLSQSPVPLTSSTHISAESALPAATVGIAYEQALFYAQRTNGYAVHLSEGTLPPGLNIVAGSISGTPTVAGNFSFRLSIASIKGIENVTEEYAVKVNAPNKKSITVAISPLNPTVAVGGKIQFAAVLGNTSNTAVSWSATGGTISAEGLFIAPTSGAKSVTVTAASQTSPKVQATTAVTIEVPDNFAIITPSVPSTAKAQPYYATLAVSGGQVPYQWSIASGSLPAGLRLDSSNGALSGSATQAGTFQFTVRSTDATAQTAQHSYSLSVSNPAENCGPPTYPCSRFDWNINQLPSAPPSVGNLSGANAIVTDPDFGNRIVRITDANTNPEATFKNRTYFTTSSGSADDNLWNVDSTLFIVQDTGANAFPFTFNPSTMQAARMYVSSFPATNGLKLNSGNWSRVNPNVLYTASATAIQEYDFSDRTNPPLPQTVYDFTSSANCLPAGFTPTWSTNGGVSGDDTVFAMGYSNAGNQGTGIYAVVYKVGSGCSILNTQTGQVAGDWGSKGTINIPDRWTIHNVKLSKDGNWLVVSNTACTSSSCSKGPYFWQIGTTNVTLCGDGGACGGHFTEGYSHWVNNDNSPMANQVIRSFAQATLVSNLTSDFPSGITIPFDQHQSWNNADPADTLPFFSSTWSTTSPFPAPWYNEIIAVAADGSGKTWRFAHTFITAKSQRFSTKYAIGTVSQDGRFFILSSDWMGSLGSESGASSCTIGSDCRGDVFVVELR